VDIGHSVRFDNKYYRTLDRNGAAAYYYSGTEGLVVRAEESRRDSAFSPVEAALSALAALTVAKYLGKN
jgi:hypothetical protein